MLTFVISSYELRTPSFRQKYHTELSGWVLQIQGRAKSCLGRAVNIPTWDHGKIGECKIIFMYLQEGAPFTNAFK